MKKRKKRKKVAEGILCTKCGRFPLPDPDRPEWDGKLTIMGDEELCPECTVGEDCLSDNNRQKMRDYHFSHIQRSGMDFGRTPGTFTQVAESERLTAEEKQKINDFARKCGVMRSEKEQKDMAFSTVPLATFRG